jgi:hypothetical protein
MELREKAGDRVRSSNKTNEYPEYDLNSIHAGITQSSTRLSFKPSLKRLANRSVISIHGLALYTQSSNGTEYASIEQCRDLPSYGKDIEIVRLGTKPIFAVLHTQNKPGNSKQS